MMWLCYMHANIENTSTSSMLTNLTMKLLSSHINVPDWEAVKMTPICGKYDPIDVNGYMQITYFATYELQHTGGKFFYLLHLCLDAFPNEGRDHGAITVAYQKQAIFGTDNRVHTTF